jgi:L-serine dehydratase
MESAIEGGLHGRPAMRLLKPSARKLLCAGRKGKRLCGGILGDACAAALAVMETDSAGGVVCAAPTGGSAGVLPGALWAASRRRRWPRRRVVEALFAAGVVGAMVSSRATFAAEVCGCAAETGVAAAMAAAALAELAGADWRACLDAACLCLMNTLGLVCDPVQGAVEIPCHARNLGAVGQALVAVEAVLGGFRPMLPLDEVIDCMLAVGRQLPASLRCTGLGGLAATPTGKQL